MYNNELSNGDNSFKIDSSQDSLTGRWMFLYKEVNYVAADGGQHGKRLRRLAEARVLLQTN